MGAKKSAEALTYFYVCRDKREGLAVIYCPAGRFPGSGKPGSGKARRGSDEDFHLVAGNLTKDEADAMARRLNA